ncbi:hypothetical protein LC612_28260 [Nostoc sp. CHAB 5834]|nr:hypothetical protein [Nostoc sp. CHAB 5834]
MSIQDLKFMPVSSFRQPTDPKRLQEISFCHSPVLCFEAVAKDATTPTQKRKFGAHFEMVEAMEGTSRISHEQEPGWPAAYALKPGRRYTTEVFECTGVVPDAKHPFDQKGSNGIIFYATCRAIENFTLKGHKKKGPSVHAVWTDGLLVDVPSGEGSPLKPGASYRIAVEEMPLEQ